MIDVGKVLTTSDFIEYKEMYILCTIWNPIGTHCMQGRHVGRSCQDCNNCQPISTIDSETIEGNIGPHRVLLEFYKGIHSDHYIDGEIT